MTYPRGEHHLLYYGRLWPYLQVLDWAGRDKRCSLFDLFINDEGKKRFMTLTTGLTRDTSRVRQSLPDEAGQGHRFHREKGP